MKRIIAFVLMLSTFGCSPEGFYKAIEDTKGGTWAEKDLLSFPFEIKDTNQRFDLYFYVRNASQYPFSNLYVKQELTLPDGTKSTDVRYNLQLFDETTGKPFGSGLGDLWDHKILIAKDIQFKQIGKHIIKLKQEMRQDPLPYLLAMGVILEPKK
jgi:gliding motility-associated lipoprotein GldH